jgi:hypothetical protein
MAAKRSDSTKPPPTLVWRSRGWVGEIVQNEDGGGWAVAMSREGDEEPVLVVPWVMGRNKKDPKPMNEADFNTQVKAANDFLIRSERQRRTAHRKSFDVDDVNGDFVRVVFDIEPDDFEPQGELLALDGLGTELARVSCAPSFRLTRSQARAWAHGGFRTPAWPE